MVGLNDDETVEHVLYGIETAKMVTKHFASWVLPYDIYFTDSGIAFVCLMDTKRSILLRDVVPGAAGGAMGAGALVGTRKTLLKEETEKNREKLKGQDLKQMMGQRKECFYLPYSEIQMATVKKKRFGGMGTMSFTTTDGLWTSEFPLDRLGVAEEAVSYHLATKMQVH